MSLTGLIFCINANKSDKRRDAGLTIPDDVSVFADINYSGKGGRFNLLDVYLPKGAEKSLPVIVSIHGGGYVYGTKEVYRFYGMSLAQQGFAFVNFNYHLAPLHKFPAPLNDTNKVLEWMTKNAEKYGFDLNNVFILGDSAGAQICSQFAAIATNPEYAGLFDFTIPQGIKLRAIALNCGTFEPSPALAKAKKDKSKSALLRDYYGINPGNKYKSFEKKIDVLSHITADYPPTYVMTAYYDFLKECAEPMYNHLTSKGVEAQWKCYGTKDTKYMGHVCHVNIKLSEAGEINRDECEFFKNHITE